jgi:hypothetical protein
LFLMPTNPSHPLRRELAYLLLAYLLLSTLTVSK